MSDGTTLLFALPGYRVLDGTTVQFDLSTGDPVTARGAVMRSSCSMNDPTGQAGSGHTQRSLRHGIRTAGPSTARRPAEPPPGRERARGLRTSVSPSGAPPSSPSIATTCRPGGRPASHRSQYPPTARQQDLGSSLVEVLAIRRGRSPLILGDLAHPTLIGEEPL